MSHSTSQIRFGFLPSLFLAALLACGLLVGPISVGVTGRAPGIGRLGPNALAGDLSSWNSQIDASTLAAVTCTSALNCLVVGGTSASAATAYKTSNGGASWSSSSVPSGTSSLRAVACVPGSPSECFAAGGTSVIQSSNGGSTWSTDTLPSGMSGIGGISCPSTSTCVAAAAGEMIYTTNGGSSWSDTSVGTHTVGGISCASTTMCVEVGANGSTSEIFVANGSLTTWANPSGPGSSPLSGVSCSSTSDCVAVGFTYGFSANTSVATYTTNGGSTWTTATGTPSGTALTSVSCISGTSTCFAVGGAIYLENYFVEVASSDYVFVGDVVATSSNGGETWSGDTNTPINDRSGLSGVYCVTTSACAAVGPQSVIDTEDGTNWVSAVASLSIAGGVSCPSTTVCYVTEGSGLIEKTENGGASWTSIETAYTGLGDIDCPTTSTCVALGEVYVYDGGGNPSDPAVISTTNGGSTWVLDAEYGGTNGRFFNAVSCASASSCVMVGTVDADIGPSSPIFFDGAPGSTWSVPTLPTLTATGFTGVSCPATSTCYVAGSLSSSSTVYEVTSSYGTWTAGTVPSGWSPGAVSCPSTTECYAASGSGMIADVGGGSTWSTISLPTLADSDSASNLTSIFCPTTSNCVTSGIDYPGGSTSNGFILTTTNAASSGSWTQQSVTTDTSAVYGVDCADSTDCWAAGTGRSSAPGAPNALVLSTNGVAGPGSELTSADQGPGQSAVGQGIELASKNSTTCSTSLPVNCASGNFSHSFTDASVPGYGPALDLTRTYNSLNASSEGIFGYGWASSYDVHLVVNSDSSVTITEEDGSQVTAIPDGSGGFDVPPWADSTLSEASGTYTFVRQGTRTFTFNSSGQLTSVADPEGATTSLSYSSGKLQTVTDPSGRTFTFAYGSNGQVSSVTDPLSRETTYGYDSSGDLTSVTDPLSRETTFTYSSSHLLLTMTDPRGGVVTNVYDSDDRVTSQTDPMGRETTFSYSGNAFSPTGGTTTITDPDSNVETEQYANGELMSLTKAAGTSAAATSTYSYDPVTAGRTTITDPDGHTTTNTYDADGNLLATTNALGNTSTYAYNSFNEVICATTPDAASPCSSLSPPSAVTAGEPTVSPPSSTPPIGVIYSQYDTDGNLIWRTTGVYDPGSGTAVHAVTTYDLHSGQSVTIGSTNDSCSASPPSGELPCATIDADGVVTQLGYDSHGDVTSSSTPDGNGSEVAETTTSYDTDGEPTTVVSPDGNVSGANAANYTTTTAYDADGEKTSVTQGASGATVTPRVTTYSYDGDGNITSTTQSDSVRFVGAVSGGDNGATDYVDLEYPEGAASGDVAFLAVSTNYGTPDNEYTVPSGWTLYGTYESGTASYSNETLIYTHTLGSGETNVPVSFSAYSGKTVYLAVYRGVNTSNPIDVATSEGGGAYSLTAASMTTGYANDRVLVFGTGINQGGAGTWEVPSGTTMQTQVTGLTWLSGYVADGQGPASAGSTQSFTTALTSDGSLVVVALALRPASGDTTTTATTTYDADNEKTSVTDADGRSTFYVYNGDGELTSQSDPIDLVGVAQAGNPWWYDFLDLNYPQGTEPGDLALLSTTLPYGESATTPTGYSVLTTENSCTSSGCITTVVYEHVVAAADLTSDVELDYSTWDEKVATLAVYAGVDPTTATDASGVGASSSSSATTVSVPATSVSAPGSTLVYFAGAISSAGTGIGSWTAPSGLTSESQVNDTSNLGQLTAEIGPVPEETTASLTATQSSEGPMTGVLVGLQPDVTTYGYDALGDETSVTTPAPAGESGTQTTTDTYDGDQRLTEVTAPPTSTSSGAPDQVTTYTYDAIGELTAETTAYGTSAASTTSYCYDPEGDRTAVVPGDGNTSGVATCSSSSPWQTSSAYQTGYEYDSIGELVTQTTPETSADPSGATTTYTYDAAGNQLTLEDPAGVTTTNTYTPTDLLASVSYSGSAAHSVSITYDADGQRTAMTDASGTSSYTYDPFGEMTSEENGAGKSVSYAYDLLGDQTSITYPLGSGATWANSDSVTYDYDSAGQLTAVADFDGTTTNLVDGATGQTQSLSLGSTGDSVESTFDGDQNPATINLVADSSGSSLLGFSYSLEPSSAIASETDTPTSSQSPADYSYDAQSRVTSMTPGSGSEISYGYDASGNLTTLPTGASTAYDDSSELTSSTLSGTTTDYTYNDDGDRTQAEHGGTTTQSASYNGANEVTAFSDAGGDITAATYDGDGLRTAITTSSGSESSQSFIWDETSATPELLIDGTNAYIYGSTGAPIEQIDLSSGTAKYLVADALGSVRGVVSASGSLSASTNYDAWGNPETSGGVTSYTPFGFAGGYTDSTGLVYLLHRYYDPGTGRFLSVDPEVEATAQPYQYAGDDPVNNSDPSGLCNQQGNGNAWDLVNPWSGNNPIRCSVEKNPNSTTTHILEANPAYQAINGYYNEAQAAENGCGFWTEAKYGAEGVLGVAGTELFALGGAGAAGGLFGSAADEGADSITGFTQHGLEQALGRDGGVGVSDSAMADAVTNPVEVEEQTGGRTLYVGTNATVVLNSDGEVITTWANNSAGWRNVP